VSDASDRLAAHLQEVIRERDPYGAPVGHAYVQAYVTQQLTGYGVVTAHEFGHLGRTHQNLVLDLPGQTDRGLVLVGAHYDAVPGSPGADDNGSALAVLLELARAFSTTPARRPIRLIGSILRRATELEVALTRKTSGDAVNHWHS
jgi:aminopeptidase YwaD